MNTDMDTRLIIGKPMPLKQTILIASALALLTMVTYWPLTGNGFLKYDDPEYVTQNDHVSQGLSIDNFLWALTENVGGNWHPLTVISHMLDCSLFGLNPSAHHMMNLFFHLINTLLLWFALRKMTEQPWQSAFVAALFALHPFHVESVAWISERKDVLSMFFWLLTLYCYTAYVKRPSFIRYGFVWIAFMLGLMAKPMVVTLPFVLLLLDYWPLNRVDLTNTRRLALLILEKIPLFILVGVSCLLTVHYQKQSEAVGSLTFFPLDTRIANALVSYVLYIYKTLWPFDLAVFYPHPLRFLWWQPLLAAGFLCIVSFWVVQKGKQQPYLPIGWFWYLGTLVPVIGLIQVGAQAMADRYTYIPLIGLFIIIAWGIPILFETRKRRRLVLAVFSMTCLVAYAGLTRLQVHYWASTETLFEHALHVTNDNYLAHKIIGGIRQTQGRTKEAIHHYEESIRIKPCYLISYIFLAELYEKKDLPEKAFEIYRKALRIDPNYIEARLGIGILYAKLGNTETAIDTFNQTLQIDADNPKVHYNLALALSLAGRNSTAIDHLNRALSIAPDFKEAALVLGDMYLKKNHIEKAITKFQYVLNLDPEYGRAKKALDRANQIRDAIENTITALKKQIDQQPQNATTYYNIACLYARLDDKSDTLDWLTKAIARGYNNWELMMHDNDLETVRQTPEFQRLSTQHLFKYR